ncbi:MAG: glycosyltransferase [Gammaproteobacteria bacterium]|nr:glycosyltransferase [Gammaproteobacteria bacterium]
MSESLVFVVPGDPDQRTGGYLYDAAVVRELRRLGWAVDVVGLAGRFPDADDQASRAMAEVLDGLASGARVLIDGLALGGVPDAVRPHAERLELTALIHHPLADETGLGPERREAYLESEARALAACRRVIVTSAFTARRLAQLGLVDRECVVVEPGVSPAPLAGPVSERLKGREPTGPERLLCVASVTPRKGQDVLVRALADLVDRDWHCVLAGSTQRDPVFALRVFRDIEAAGLTDRVDCIGECDADALEAEYSRAGVCLLPSHFEGYGMVVTESLARGLPMITTTGGALAETAPADSCLRVEPDDADALRDALARWLDDGDLRRAMTQCAAARRPSLRDWPTAGREFTAALGARAA